MTASACLTLAVIHFCIWVRDRRRYAYMLFSVSAVGAALTGLFELLTLNARSVAQYEWAMYWGQIPEALLAISMVWFIRVYFQAGHRWILIAITALWTLLLLLNFSSPHTIEFRQITGLYEGTSFWGERFAQAKGEPNPWRYLGDAASALMVVFVVDASVALWRRGSRYRAIIAGGTAIILLLSSIHNPLVDAGLVHTPYMVSLFFLTIVVAMSYELGSDVLRAAQLVRQLKASEAALRESEARFRILADTAPVMIWMSGTDKLCTFFNKGWLDFTGRSLEQELGDGWAEGVHREDFDCCFEVYVNSFDARQPFTMEYRLQRSDGAYRWVLDNGAPRCAADGTFLGYIGSCIDITERKQAEDRFRLVVEASPNGVVLVEAQGHIVLVNAHAEKMFGYGREELIGQDIEVLVPERFRSEHLAHRAGFHAAAPAAWAVGAGLELFARRKDETEFPVEIRISPIQSPAGTLFLNLIVDITERRQAEAEARQHREELAHLSRVAIMGEMAGSLAHELNQPLTGIVNNASAGRRLIAKGRANLPKLDGLFEAVVADGRRAGEIIRGIRGMVRKGEEVRGPVNLNDVISSVLRFIRSDALERHCMLVTETDPKLPLVGANQVQLQQVLLNLVVNAFEAMRETPAEERRLIIRSERESDGRVRVSVRDFGTGLPAEEPEQIFQQFFSTKREGMGMGLPIARSIINSHGGELAAANAEGGGACVHFSLPIIAEGQRGCRESRQLEEAQRHEKIRTTRLRGG